MESLVKSCNICWVLSGMPGHGEHSPKKQSANISELTLELFCLFFACSYTPMDVTVLSCRFSWIWSCMPKVLWNNKLPISLERVVQLC